jgi:hypothetical protein
MCKPQWRAQSYKHFTLISETHTRRERRMPEAVWAGAVRRKLAVRGAVTCRQHLQPSTRPPEQVISVSWPSMGTTMKVVPLLDKQEQRLVLLWILLDRRSKR